MTHGNDLVAPPAESAEVVRHRVCECAGRLHHAIRGLVGRIPSAAEGPQAFARDLRLHKSLAGKLLNAAKLADPLAAVHQLPRAEGLRIFLRAAEPSVGKDDVSAADLVVGEFQAIVKRDLGGWDMLNVAISSWLPEARAKAEIAHSRQVYNGLCGVLGVTADAELCTVIYYPSPDGENCDVVMINQLMGLRRLRPGAEVAVDAIGPGPNVSEPANAVRSLSDAEAPDDPPLMTAFCSSPLPPLRIVESGNLRHLLLAGDAFGARSGVDLCFGVVCSSARPRYRPESGPRMRYGAASGAGIPVKRLVLTMLLEEGIYPGCEPELVVHRTHERGLASPNDPSRDMDRLQTTAFIHHLGTNPSSSHLAEFGRYLELLQYVRDKLGWDFNRLRGYRCRVDYPLCIAQYSIIFEPPPRGSQC